MTEPEYLWHATIQTGHTRRSFRSEVAPEIIELVGGWLKSDHFALPPGGGYECVITRRVSNGLLAEVRNGQGTRLVEIGVANHSAFAAELWEHLGGAPDARPHEPWCAVSLDAGLMEDPAATEWLGDFERCLAWAWLAEQKS